MTYREKLQQEHPETVSNRYWGGCRSCPDSYGYEDYSECDESGRNCEACWDREIPEKGKMNNLILYCIDAIEENMADGELIDADSRLKYALMYLSNDEEISELYELIKNGKAPGAGKQSGTQ